jgi:hypothetical protein
MSAESPVKPARQANPVQWVNVVNPAEVLGRLASVARPVNPVPPALTDGTASTEPWRAR